MTDRRPILVAVDLPLDVSDLAPVLDLAKGTGCSVHLLHCSEPDPAFVGYFEARDHENLQRRLDELPSWRDRLEQEAAKLRALGINTEVHLIPGPIVETILACADDIDAQLIAVLGRKQSVAHRMVLGSVVSSLLKATSRPVLVIPPADNDDDSGSPVLTAVDRLLEIIGRPGMDESSELSDAALEFREAAETGSETPETESNRLREALHRFETDHPTLTRAVNDVAYYLSGMGL